MWEKPPKEKSRSTLIYSSHHAFKPTLYKGSHPLPNWMFFYTLCKGEGGVEPMCKNLCCRFLQFWRPSENLKLTHKKTILKAKLSQIKKKWHFFHRFLHYYVEFFFKILFLCVNFRLSEGLQNCKNLQHEFLHMGTPLSPPLHNV